MLPFFRKYAGQILIVTVIFFVLSIIIPVILENMSRRPEGGARNKPVNTKNIALVNSKPINSGKFMQLINQSIGSITPPQQKSKLDPRIGSRIMYDALWKTIDHTLILHEAKKKGVRASGSEINNEIEGVKKAYNLKNNSELKEMLKRNNYSFKDFKQLIADELVVRKMVQKIQNEVAVSEEDVLNKFKQVKAKHILIKNDYQSFSGEKEKTIKDADAYALKKAKEIAAKLEAGEDFSQLAIQYSGDPGSAKKGGDLGWFKQGQMVPEFEAKAFSMKPGEISKPVRTVFGYHIILVEDIKKEEIPIDIDEQELKKKMLEEKRRTLLDNWYANLVRSAKIEVVDKTLLAYKYKMEGNFTQALQEYKLLAAQNPNDPMGHVFVGEIYEQLGSLDQAEKEYERGLLKIKLNKSLDNPFIYMAYGNLEMRKGNTTAGITKLRHAESLAGDSISTYSNLGMIYKQYGFMADMKRMERKVQQLRELFSANLEKDLDTLTENREASNAAELEMPTLTMPEVPETVLPKEEN